MENQDEAELCFPQLLNMSCMKPKLRQSDAGMVYLLFFISVLTVILNLLVIISVSHFRQLHTPTNLLLLSLAVSDFFMGLMVTLIQVYRQTECWYLSDLICSLLVCLIYSIISVSIGGMVLISVDRYVAICDPLHYPTRVTVRRVRILIFMCWFCSLLYNSIIFRDSFTKPGNDTPCYGDCTISIDDITLAVDYVLTLIVPVTSIICLYMRVFLTAVSQARAMRSHVAATTLHHSRTVLTKKSELKAARTLGIVVAWFLISFCPNYCLGFVPSSVVNNLPAPSGVFLLCLSPCLNPVIYALFYPWFRKAIRLIISLQILQPGSSETNNAVNRHCGLTEI